MYRTSIYAEGNNITKSDLYQNGSHIKKRFNLVNIAQNNLDIHKNHLSINIRIQNISHKQTESQKSQLRSPLNIHSCSFKVYPFFKKMIIADEGVKLKESPDDQLQWYMVRVQAGYFKCRECPDLDFRCSGNLRAHVESHHYSPGYKCPNCQKMFKIRNVYSKHVKKCGSVVTWTQLTH